MSWTRAKTWLYRMAPVLVLVLALSLRLYGIRWDGGYRFHPDERQILFVANKLQFPWPPDASLLSPASSWNPDFFAYGSLPIYLLRVVADLLSIVWKPALTLSGLAIVGRMLSALFDLGSVYLVYRIGDEVYDRPVALLGALLVAGSVLHVQLAHFYAVDTVLTFFVLLTLYFCLYVIRKGSLRSALALGASLGAAVASKVSAVPLVLTALLAWFCYAHRRNSEAKDGQAGWGNLSEAWQPLVGLIVTGCAALISFVLLEPYAVIDFIDFASDVISEGFMARGATDVPYTRQYMGRLPYLYLMRQTIVWAMGLPLGLAAFGGWIGALIDLGLRMGRRRWEAVPYRSMLLSWTVIYFGLIGSFHAKFLRYMLPILPLLALWAAWGLCGLYRALRKRNALRGLATSVIVVVVVSALTYSVAYPRMYRQTHPWINASQWICQNASRPSVLMVEHWDHTLPLLQGEGNVGCSDEHVFVEFPAYDQDDLTKERILLAGLRQSDYIVVASQRLYGTVPRLPERYPMTTRYYELLMAGELGYELVHFDARYPNLGGLRLVDDPFEDASLPVPGLLADDWARDGTLNLGRADESYAVYDHPVPLIFENKEHLSLKALRDLFGQTLPSERQGAQE